MRRLGIVVAVIATILGGSGCGSGGSARKASTAAAKEPRAAVAALLAGIPQRGSTLGQPGAPVTLEYFGDLQCPFCREFTLGALAALIPRYVRTGTLKIEYRSLESATRDPQTFRTQQAAALAAGRQNKLWNFVLLFTHEQGTEDSGYVSESYLQGLAEQVSGLNLLAWSVARDDPRLLNMISRDARVSAAVGFRGTPSFLFANTAGDLRRFKPRTLVNVAPYALAVEALLRLNHRRRAGGQRASSS